MVLHGHTVSVYTALMGTFHETLNAYLAEYEGGECGFAEKLGCSQATVNRYRNNERFPNADMARLIDRQTDGAVPFELWQQEFLTRSGLAA